MNDSRIDRELSTTPPTESLENNFVCAAFEQGVRMSRGLPIGISGNLIKIIPAGSFGVGTSSSLYGSHRPWCFTEVLADGSGDPTDHSAEAELIEKVEEAKRQAAEALIRLKGSCRACGGCS